MITPVLTRILTSAMPSLCPRQTFVAFLRRTDENTLGRIVVESAILLAASRANASQVLRDAATAYKVDTDAIAAKVKQEFATKDKVKAEKKPVPQSSARQPKTAKRPAAA